MTDICRATLDLNNYHAGEQLEADDTARNDYAQHLRNAIADNDHTLEVINAYIEMCESGADSELLEMKMVDFLETIENDLL